jgi:hypothetical protein
VVNELVIKKVTQTQNRIETKRSEGGGEETKNAEKREKIIEYFNFKGNNITSDYLQ